MRNLVHKLSYEPKIILWLVFFFFAFICTVLPLGGPIFLGFIIYRIVKMGELKNIIDGFAPTVLGIITFSLIFYLPNWSFENFVIVTFFNLLCLGVAPGWARSFS